MLKTIEREWLDLYEWALKYARGCRPNLLEIEDVMQEMIIAVLGKRWKSAEYAKQAMRNKLIDLVRRGELGRKLFISLDEHEIEKPVFDEDIWEARDLVCRLMEKSEGLQAKVLDHLLIGRTIEEIALLEKLSLRTVYRYIQKSRNILDTITI